MSNRRTRIVATLGPATDPPAVLRAILAARLWMAANLAWAQGQAWWHSERRLRAEQVWQGARGVSGG